MYQSLLFAVPTPWQGEKIGTRYLHMHYVVKMILKSVLIVLEARLQQKPPLRYANSTHINDSLSFAEDLALPHYPPECQDGWPPSITQASHRRQAKNHHYGKSGLNYRHTLIQKYGVCCA